MWTVPRMPDDDIGAVLAVAAGYAELADGLRGAGALAQLALGVLPGGWSGAAAAASTHPTAVLLSDVDLVCRGLVEAVDALNRCAGELRRAHERHGWSWGKVLKVGAVVVVSAAAVTVTAGAAAPEVAAADGAIIGGEVASAEVAVASAAAARTGAGLALTTSSRLLAGVRGLSALVRPQLPWASAFTGLDAAEQIKRTDRLDPGELAIGFGINLVMPASMRGTRVAVRGLPVLAGRRGGSFAASHLAAGGVVAGFDAGRQQALTGRVDTGRVVRAGVTGAGFSAAGDGIEKILPMSWRPGVAPAVGIPETGVPRQTLDAALGGDVDLPAHEGPTLGHTLARHVGKPFSFLQRRLDTERGDVKSSFTDEATASRAVTETLRAHAGDVRAFERGDIERLDPLRLTFGGALGKVLDRDGARFLGRTCTVVLRRDGHGAFVLTAWVDR
jgi:hypothetical protein